MLINAVAPFAGAWIEMMQKAIAKCMVFVAPFAGAWIEIKELVKTAQEAVSRSLRGSVD